MLEASAVTWLPPATLRRDPARLEAALDAIAARAERLYLHVDLDVLDPGALRANLYACAGGLSVEDVVAAMGAARARLEVAAVAVTAFDPRADEERRGPEVVARLLAAVAAAR